MTVAPQQVSESDALRNSRNEAYDLLRSTLHPTFATEFIEKGGKSLTIVFSPNNRFMLRKYEFRHDVLYVADKKLHYYTHNPGRQTKILAAFLEAAGYENVVFVGSSKGGTGALLWSSLTTRRRLNCKIVAIAFSPQVILYPFNDNLRPLPSYVNNMKLVDVNETHRINFQNYGDLPDLIDKASSNAVVIFGRNATMDATEACRLSAIPSVILRPIDVSFHGSVIPFVTDLDSDAAIIALADKLTKDASIDHDLSATITQAREDFIRELKNIRCPSLNDLIDQSVLRFSDGRFV